jgi:hypothetical protein
MITVRTFAVPCNMSADQILEALHTLEKYAFVEPDADKLRLLLLQINRVLDVIETRIAGTEQDRTQ